MTRHPFLRPRPRWAVGILSASALVLAGCSSNEMMLGQDDGLMSVVQGSADAEPSDVMFAQMMIPHHQQAVVMADLAADRASDPFIRQLAQDIKSAQDPEIKLMSSWLSEWGIDPMMSVDDLDSHAGHGMSGMLTDDQLDELRAADGPAFDALFAAGMIAHHEGAIEMARDVLDAGGSAEVAQLAREIIVEQEKEILQMRAFLNADEVAAESLVPITPAMGHVHGAVMDGGDLLVGSHDGVHRVDPASGVSQRVGSSQDDFMGFAGRSDALLVASGHPGPGSPLPNPLGLIASDDGGQTWQGRSLQGDVDFHGLTVRGEDVVGWDTRGFLQSSLDGGATWLAGPLVTATSLTWFGDDVWVATTEQGLVTWRPGDSDVIAQGQPAVLLAASRDGDALWRVDADGSVHRSLDGVLWRERGAVSAIEALAVDRDRAFAVTGGLLQQVN